MTPPLDPDFLSPTGQRVRVAAIPDEYEARYPVADADIPPAERSAADERALNAVLRERAARQAGMVVTHG